MDDETDRVATAAVRAAYAAAIELVAPHVLARINGLTAAGDGENDEIITDAEWAALAEEHVDDAIGDGVLDGVVAGASQFLKLASPQNVIKAFTAAASSFAGFASELRSKIDTWIGNKIGQGITGDWGIGKVIEELGLDSPLSKDKADLVAATETQAACQRRHVRGVAGRQPSSDPVGDDARREGPPSTRRRRQGHDPVRHPVRHRRPRSPFPRRPEPATRAQVQLSLPPRLRGGHRGSPCRRRNEGRTPRRKRRPCRSRVGPR